MIYRNGVLANNEQYQKRVSFSRRAFSLFMAQFGVTVRDVVCYPLVPAERKSDYSQTDMYRMLDSVLNVVYKDNMDLLS